MILRITFRSSCRGGQYFKMSKFNFIPIYIQLCECKWEYPSQQGEDEAEVESPIQSKIISKTF